MGKMFGCEARLQAVSLLLKNPWGRTQNKLACERYLSIWLLTECRPSTECRSTIDQYSVNCRRGIGDHEVSAKYQWTRSYIGRHPYLSTDISTDISVDVSVESTYSKHDPRFHPQDLISNSSLSLPYDSCDVSLENLVLDQLKIAT